MARQADKHSHTVGRPTVWEFPVACVGHPTVVDAGRGRLRQSVAATGY